ncbi:basic proline-rich protein-like [Corvus cornix cornix]|uniref:basic proline-rich protein-like n=1 Tax=Corvus cornix cornix TaxID=932674 RepID=UPI00194EED26|nr:basic proline-rich protein-like [Corvus cornix cornix]
MLQAGSWGQGESVSLGSESCLRHSPKPGSPAPRRAREQRLSAASGAGGRARGRVVGPKAGSGRGSGLGAEPGPARRARLGIPGLPGRRQSPGSPRRAGRSRSGSAGLGPSARPGAAPPGADPSPDPAGGEAAPPGTRSGRRQEPEPRSRERPRCGPGGTGDGISDRDRRGWQEPLRDWRWGRARRCRSGCGQRGAGLPPELRLRSRCGRGEPGPCRCRARREGGASPQQALDRAWKRAGRGDRPCCPRHPPRPPLPQRRPPCGAPPGATGAPALPARPRPQPPRGRGAPPAPPLPGPPHPLRTAAPASPCPGAAPLGASRPPRPRPTSAAAAGRAAPGRALAPRLLLPLLLSLCPLRDRGLAGARCCLSRSSRNCRSGNGYTKTTKSHPYVNGSSGD